MWHSFTKTGTYNFDSNLYLGFLINSICDIVLTKTGTYNFDSNLYLGFLINSICDIVLTRQVLTTLIVIYILEF